MPFTPAIPLVPGRPSWCFHIGRVLDYKDCPCHFKWVFSCDLFEKCYLIPNAQDPAVKNCRDCPNYDPQ